MDCTVGLFIKPLFETLNPFTAYDYFIIVRQQLQDQPAVEITGKFINCF
jgi:hypothetical protein